MEIKQQVNTFRVYFKCDKCKDGEMIAGHLFRQETNEHSHDCNKCKATTWIKNKRYPFFEYKDILAVTIPHNE